MNDGPAIFLTFAAADREWAARIRKAIVGAQGVGGAFARNVALDDPGLDDAAWESAVAPVVGGCDLVVALAPVGDVADTTDAALSRALSEAAAVSDRRRSAGGRGPLIVPVLRDDALGFYLRYALPGACAFDRAPPAGGLSDPPFDGDEDAWLAAAASAIRDMAEGEAAAAQRAPPDLAMDAAGCIEAAERLERAGESERDTLLEEFPGVVDAAGAVGETARLADADVLARAEAVRGALLHVRRIALGRSASATLGATEAAIAALFALEDAARARGYRRPPLAAPDEPAIDLADPQAGPALAAAQASFKEIADVGAAFRDAASGEMVSPKVEALSRQIEGESRVAAGIAAAGALAAWRLSPDPIEWDPARRFSLEPLRSAHARVARGVNAAQALPYPRLGRHAREIVRRLSQLVERASQIVGSLVALSRGRGEAGSRRRPPLTALEVWPEPLDGVAVSGWPEMVTLPPGRFLMGSPPDEEGRYADEDPQHPVWIRRIVALGRYPVTFAQWDAARTAGADLPEPNDAGGGRGRRPVINVSWHDAQAYIAWLNDRLNLAGEPDAYRLPSEAEWEYACRAGTTTPFHFGDTISTAHANYDGNYTYGHGARGRYRERTTPVDAFGPNPWGLFDMHGNVWEWCEDSWHEDYTGAPADGSPWRKEGDVSSRVVRGGSWDSNPRSLRSAYRVGFSPSDRYDLIGFRLARTLSDRAS